MPIRKLQGFLFLSIFFLVLEFSVVQSDAIPPGTLTLAWDPSSDPSVVGYRLYEGTASQSYNSVLDVGSNLTATVLGLVAGETYYFAVTAYDISGLESTFSGQISYTVPTSAPEPPMLARLFVSQNNASQAVLRGTGPAGYVYDVCASIDLSSWVVIGTVTVDATGAFQFADGASSALSWRFYRLRQNTP